MAGSLALAAFAGEGARATLLVHAVHAAAAVSAACIGAPFFSSGISATRASVVSINDAIEPAL